MRASILGIENITLIGLLREDFNLVYNIFSGGMKAEMEIVFFDHSRSLVIL